MNSDVLEYIKLCCVKKNIKTDKELAQKIGETPQNYSLKKRKGNYTISYLELIASALNADLNIQFIDKETGKPII